MAFKKWVISDIDKLKAKQLAEECDVDAFLALMAYSRGYTEPYELDMFLSRDSFDFDPFSLIGMEEAVARINKALAEKEKIVIYGDYDCDGITSTALLFDFLKSMDAVVDYFVPNRKTDGYGINLKQIDNLASSGTDLIITVDNGINAIDEINRAKEYGIDVIVTDHHIQSGNLPNAVAVINPHRNDSDLEFKDFAGVGVAFLLALALSNYDPEYMLKKYSDLVALGTIADVMPLKNENRSLVWYGVNKINKNPSVGVKALFAAVGAKFGEITSGNIAFTAAPRLNAAGRMGDASRGVRLLTESDYAAAMQLAFELDDENLKRQATEQSIIALAEEKIILQKLYNNRIIVVAGENWHEGVLGIAAAKLAEKFSKPTILLSTEGDTDIVKGSARSVGDFSIFSAINSCFHLLLKYGGHNKAAGLSLKKENISEFSNEINKQALKQQFPVSVINIDCKLNPAALNTDLVYSLKPLEPYGVGNSKPVFGLFGMRLKNIIPLSAGKHLKITVSKNNISVTMLIFGVSEQEFPFKTGAVLDFAVTLEMRDYKGQEQLNILVKDFKLSNTIDDDVITSLIAYNDFSLGDFTTAEAELLSFDRNNLALVYRAIKEGYNTVWKLRSNIIQLPLAKILAALDTLEELELVKTEGVFDSRKIFLLNSDKVNLETSKIYSNLINYSR